MTPADDKTVATWVLLSIGTALQCGITPQQIRRALQPKFVSAAIGIVQQPKPDARDPSTQGGA